MRPPKWLVISIIIVAFVGFLDATYLTVKHYSGEVPPCSILNGCEEVTTSRYATIGNIPISLVGAIFYLTIIALSIAYLDTKKDILIKSASRLTILGFAVTLFLLYLQFFVIKAVCIYCLVSAATSAVLFILGLTVLKYNKEKWI